jgi:hypothetical protein
MTTPGGQPFNVAGDHANVGVQGQTVTITGDVQLTVGQDASPAERYRVGVDNLESGNPEVARKLIWEAMMGRHMNGEVLFHWLVAMLSGRTVRQFSKDEIGQLHRFRSRYAETGSDAWADGGPAHIPAPRLGPPAARDRGGAEGGYDRHVTPGQAVRRPWRRAA